MDVQSEQFLGGTEPKTFPHVCPHVKTGADRHTCRQFTKQFLPNRDGCRGTSDLPACNSEERLCPVCLALDPSGRTAKKTFDVKSGCCRIHVTVEVKKPDAVELVPAEASVPVPEVVVEEVIPPAPVPVDAPTGLADVEPDASLADAPEVELSVAQDDAVRTEPELDPEEIAQRVRLAKLGEGKMPSAFEVFAAAKLLSTSKKNVEIARIFGQDTPSGPVWVSNVLALRKLSEEAWILIHRTEMRGRHVPLSWLAKVARSEVSTHMQQLNEWAATKHYVRYDK